MCRIWKQEVHQTNAWDNHAEFKLVKRSFAYTFFNKNKLTKNNEAQIAWKNKNKLRTSWGCNESIKGKNFYNKGETQQAIALTYFDTNKPSTVTNTVLYNIHILSYLLQILYPVTKCMEVMYSLAYMAYKNEIRTFRVSNCWKNKNIEPEENFTAFY